jgi:hypothetical protein
VEPHAVELPAEAPFQFGIFRVACLPLLEQDIDQQKANASVERMKSLGLTKILFRAAKLPLCGYGRVVYLGDVGNRGRKNKSPLE